MIYAIDFDGTICREAFPDIGEPIPEAVWGIRELKRLGHTIILWTCRGGERLQEALRWLDMLGVPIDYANENDPGQNELYGNDSRKVGAFRYVDDKSAGRWSWREIIEEARAMEVGRVAFGPEVHTPIGPLPEKIDPPKGGSGQTGLPRTTVVGVGPEAPTVTNERGGKQSASPYRIDLIDPRVLLEQGEILAKGAAKYGEENWKNLSEREIINHALVHILAWLAGDRTDNHLGHGACRLLMARTLELGAEKHD